MSEFKPNEADILYIENNYMICSIDDLAKRFNVSKSTINRLLRKRGLSKTYSKEEEDFITEHYKEYTLDEITSEINKRFHNGIPVRTKNGVKDKASKRGLTRKINIGDEIVFNGVRSRYTYIRLGNGKHINKSLKVYQETYGDIPKGFKVVHLDGDYSNYNPDNLIAVDNVAFGTYLGMKNHIKSNDPNITKCLWQIAQLQSIERGENGWQK